MDPVDAHPFGDATRPDGSLSEATIEGYEHGDEVIAEFLAGLVEPSRTTCRAIGATMLYRRPSASGLFAGLFGFLFYIYLFFLRAATLDIQFSGVAVEFAQSLSHPLGDVYISGELPEPDVTTLSLLTTPGVYPIESAIVGSDPAHGPRHLGECPAQEFAGRAVLDGAEHYVEDGASICITFGIGICCYRM